MSWTRTEQWLSGNYRIERIDGGRYVASQHILLGVCPYRRLVGKKRGYETLEEAQKACEQHAGGKG